MPVRNAQAVWTGSLKEGKGNLSFGTFSGQYSFSSRFEEGEGTNPEELIGAAHAGCFSMALSGNLTRAGFEPVSIDTTAKVHLTKKEEGGFAISKIELHTKARVPDIDEDTFMEQAEAAKKGCPVSQALAAIGEITLNAELVS